jgi:iron complex transport system ATP-binding protein
MPLVIDSLSFAYGRVPVLRNLFAGPLHRGTVAALVGPNGSGKSTLFRCIAGSSKPQAGQIRLDDRDLARESPRERARRVFHLSQDLSSRAALTVFETVLLARKSLAAGITLRAGLCDLRAVQRALDDLGLGPLSGRSIAALSGGQRQLVGIAQALVREPDILLLDEPTSALDVRRQLEVMQVIREVTRGRAIVTIAAMHDLALAARFADRLLVLRDGRIAEEGAPGAVLAGPGVGETYGVGIHVELSRRGSLLVESYLPPLRAAE